MPMPPKHVIGTSPRKVDAVRKVTGQTQYAGDLKLPRQLYCKLLRSTQPYARIARINTIAAQQQPGVVRVITGTELPKPYGILTASLDEHPLAVDKVRFVGDPVAAVVAVSEEQAAAALSHIEVEYIPLQPVMSMEQALATPSDEPLHVSTECGNIQKMVAMQFGNTEQGFAEADLIQEDYIFYQGNTHLAMEKHATLAHYEADGKLTVWSSTQTPHYLHRTLADYFELPASRVRVIAPPTGGGFGGKGEPFNHELVVAKLAMLTGRPVKIVLTREEVFYVHRGRHPVLMRIKTGVKANGAITAMDFEAVLDGGAYGSYGIVTTHYVGALQTVTYNVPTYRFRGARVLTNKPPCGPKRGHGTPQPRFALEVQMDKIAEKLGMNPLDLRLNHLALPYSQTANHLTITTTGLEECLQAVAERATFRQRYGQLPTGRGLGLAASAYITGATHPIYANQMPHAGVQLLLDRGGGVTVFCGSTDIGQGSDSILAMIVAEELGLGVQDIHVVTSDTALTPVDLGSFSSRVTLMTGNAALAAVRRIKTKLLQTASRVLRVEQATLTFADRRVSSSENSKRSIAFSDLVKLAEAEHGTLGSTGSYTPPERGGRYRGAVLGPSPAYTFSACVAQVQVDLESAELAVEKIWLAHDVGRALNPRLVEAQVEGSVYMGLGEALMEEQIFRRGLHQAPSMLDYKSPTFLEMPEIETILIESNEPEGPYGAKEAGQGPMLSIAPAVANAVYDAVGVRIDETPITAAKIFQALQLKSKGAVARIGPTHMPTVVYPELLQLESQWGKPASMTNRKIEGLG